VTSVLLSRMAESIYWIGRYVERAEGTARILDVVVHHTLEQRGADSSGTARRLQAVMGLQSPPEDPDLWAVTEALAHDLKNRSSIAGSIMAARDNARTVRHVIPVELWERLNATWMDLSQEWKAARRTGPGSFLAYVKNQCAAISGLADSTMSRDQVWMFFTLGRSLERTDVVARQLGSLPFDTMTDSGLVTLLRSCGGYEPYLRLAHGVVDLERVIDFLMRDRLFPRSAFACLVQAQQCLAEICGDSAEWDEARGLIGLARAELEFAAPGTLSRQLPTRLRNLEVTCSAVNEAVARRYFSNQAATEWQQGASW
jgi:uncharacterized alpha-E superfamily protein